MTIPTRTIDPIVKILLERSIPSEDRDHSSTDKLMIETLRSVQLANLICTNTIMSLVANRDASG
ncbi:MAG: hypothetical protein IID58_13580 [Proteobacteria bacterium]|nr:hypothetical protein [Pseudomonadota bacterium]